MARPSIVAANASSLTSAPKRDHITLFQDVLKTAFATAVAESEADEKVKIAFVEIEKAKKIPDSESRNRRFLEIHGELDKSTLAAVLEIDAKQQDILRRARKAATNNIVSAYKAKHFDQSHSLASELRKCHAAGISAVEVQAHLDQHFRAIFSLTGHPTNPTTVAYTAAGYELDEVLDQNSKADEAVLKAVLQKILATPMSGEKKKPMEEAAETDLALRNIRTSEPRLRAKFEDVIANSPYAGQIRVPKTLTEISVWTHGGDADGNDNMTAQVLESGYQSLERQGSQVNVDIRHDAGDVMKAMVAALEQIGEKLPKNPDEQAKKLAEILRDPTAIEKLKAIDVAQITDKKAAEILKRLRVCGQHPGATEKFIIANTEGVNHALSALLLLKITGNKVAEEGAKIDIVTLSESVEDLQKIHDVQKALLDDATYREHLKHRGRIVQMIAKSDTTRVGGSGVEFYQDKAAGEAYFLGKIAQEKYGLNLEVRVFNGGGAALQRGGGRPDEAPLRHAKSLVALAQENVWENPRKGPTLSTIQGHQQQLMFSAGECVDNSLEGAMAQNLHSAFIAEGRLQSKDKVGAGEEKRGEFCDEAIANYQKKYFGNKFLNDLFANSNRAGVALANLSSRPAKRGAGAPEVGPGITFAQLSGDRKDFDLFATRAITLDRTLAHSGTFAVMFLGLKEAFEKHSPAEMHEVYQENKAFRDFIRNQVTALYMVDLDHAWKMMAGQERPNRAEIEELAKKFENLDQISDEKERQKITMAFLDNYISEVGKHVYSAFTNEAAPRDLELKSLLRIYSPELAKEMDYRERDAGFAKLVERETVARFNANDGQKLSEEDFRIVRYSYNGDDIALNAPVATLATQSSMVRDHPHVHQVQALTHKLDESQLPLSPVLRRFALQVEPRLAQASL